MVLIDLLTVKPSPDKFATKFAKALRAAGHDGFAYDPDQFQFRLEGDHIINLSNFYTDYCDRRGADRRETIPRAIASIVQAPEIPGSFDEAKPYLLPRIREASFPWSMRTQVLLQYGEDRGMAPADRPFAEAFSLSLCLDFPETIAVVSQKQLDDWGATFDEALAVARENLWNRSKENFKELAPGLYVSPWQDDQDATRLFLPELIAQVPVQGNPVAIIPHRSFLFVTGSEDIEGLRALAQASISAVEREPHRHVSLTPVILDAHEWKPFTPSSEHELHDEFCRLHQQQIAAEYGEQKGLLDALHEKQGDDLFAASVFVIEKQDSGGIHLSTIWGKDVDALLPEVDSVMVMESPDDEPGMVPWEEVRRIAGNLMEKADMTPSRWRVRRFPDSGTLEQLKAAFVDIE